MWIEKEINKGNIELMDGKYIGTKDVNDNKIVLDDLIGLSGFYPKFVKKYINLEKILNKVIKKFRNDVIKNNFPKTSNTY